MINPIDRPDLMPELVIRQLSALMDALTCTFNDGFTYALRDGSGLTKIGSSRGLVSRIRALQASNGSRLELLGIAHSVSVETMLHLRLHEHRMHGEWFRLDHNPLPIVSGRCIACSPMSRDDEAVFEFARMQDKERRTRLDRADHLRRDV